MRRFVPIGGSDRHGLRPGARAIRAQPGPSRGRAQRDCLAERAAKGGAAENRAFVAGDLRMQVPRAHDPLGRLVDLALPVAVTTAAVKKRVNASRQSIFSPGRVSRSGSRRCIRCCCLRGRCHGTRRPKLLLRCSSSARLNQRGSSKQNSKVGDQSGNAPRACRGFIGIISEGSL